MQKALLVSFISIAASFLPVHAAGLIINPAPQNLDADPIDDVILGPGQQLVFNVLFDRNNIPANASSVEFLFSYDQNEISLIKLVGKAIEFNLNDPNCLGGGFNGCNIKFPFNPALAANANPALVGTFTMVGINPELWPGNGVADVSFANAKYSDVNNNVFNLQPYEFEVQQVPAPVPAPLPALGLAVCARYARRLRKLSSRIRSTKDLNTL